MGGVDGSWGGAGASIKLGLVLSELGEGLLQADCSGRLGQDQTLAWRLSWD